VSAIAAAVTSTAQATSHPSGAAIFGYCESLSEYGPYVGFGNDVTDTCQHEGFPGRTAEYLAIDSICVQWFAPWLGWVNAPGPATDTNGYQGVACNNAYAHPAPGHGADSYQDIALAYCQGTKYPGWTTFRAIYAENGNPNPWIGAENPAGC
jgi:hypothetical protein